MKKRSYTEVLEKFEKELNLLKKETKIGIFESNYLAVLFSTLGISFPIFLFKQELASSGLSSLLIWISLRIYAPFILLALVLNFVSIFLRERLFKAISIGIVIISTSFIPLFIFFVWIDSNWRVFSEHPKTASVLFFISWTFLIICGWSEINKFFKELYGS